MRQSFLAANSLAVVLFVCSSALARAEYLVGVSWTGAIYRFGQNFDDRTLLQQTSWHFNSLTKDNSGRLLATATDAITGQSWDNLFEINAVTGEATLMGRINVANGTRDQGYAGIRSLASSANGILYGTLATSARPQQRNELIAIDASALTATIVGDLPEAVQGLTFAPDNTLYALVLPFRTPSLNPRGLAILDPTSLALTDCFATDDNYFVNDQTLAFDSAGQLYEGRRQLVSINLQTGQYAARGSLTTLDIRGMEFVIPEPSTLTLGSFALLSLASLPRRNQRLH